MSPKTTIFVTTIAAISIGALGAGAAMGLVDGVTPAGPTAQTQFAPADGLGPGAQSAYVGPEAAGGPGQSQRFAPGGQDANGPLALRGGRGGGNQMTRGGGQQIMRGGGQQAAGHWRLGRPGGEDRDLELTADEAGTLVSAQLILQGNDRLKVGGVVSQGEDTYVVDVVTVDDSLVMQIEIDRDTGRRSIVR